MSTENKKTSLYDHHVKLSAKMVPFAGFSMPIQYSSVKSESIAVRDSCGVFDVSHMGEFFIKGPDAYKFINYLVTNEVESLPIGKAVYSPLCRENGTVIDDLIVYKLEAEKALICVNASNIEKDWEWINKHKGNFDVELENKSDDYSLLAIQGPKTESILTELGVEGLNNYEYYSAKESSFQSQPIICARTGYTGEDGFEIFGNHETIKTIWEKLIGQNVTPCGLAARDVLRTEVAFPLYGQDIHDEVTPLDSALKWTIKFDKQNFIGKTALEDNKSRYMLKKLVLDKGIPRPGYEVLNTDGKVVGVITSGTMSVALGKGIALAHIEREQAKGTEKFIVNIRNKHYDASSIKGSFIKAGRTS